MADVQFFGFVRIWFVFLGKKSSGLFISLCSLVVCSSPADLHKMAGGWLGKGIASRTQLVEKLQGRSYCYLYLGFSDR